jgi:hypothetical protein
MTSGRRWPRGQLKLNDPDRALAPRAHQPEAAPTSALQCHRARNRHPQINHRVEKNPRPFVWTETADQILVNLSRMLRLITWVRTLDGA